MVVSRCLRVKSPCRAGVALWRWGTELSWDSDSLPFLLLLTRNHVTASGPTILVHIL